MYVTEINKDFITWLASMMKLSSILQHPRFMEMAVNLVYDYS